MGLDSWKKGPLGKIARGLAVAGSIAGGAQGTEARTHHPQDELRPTRQALANEFRKQDQVIDQFIKGKKLSPEILQKYRPLLALFETRVAKIGEERQAAFDAALPVMNEFTDHLVRFETMRYEIVKLRNRNTGHFQALLQRREGAPEAVRDANLVEEHMAEIARNIIPVISRLPQPDILARDFLADPDALMQGTLSHLNQLFKQFFDPSTPDAARERALAYLAEEYFQQLPATISPIEELPDELNRQHI